MLSLIETIFMAIVALTTTARATADDFSTHEFYTSKVNSDGAEVYYKDQWNYDSRRYPNAPDSLDKWQKQVYGWCQTESSTRTNLRFGGGTIRSVFATCPDGFEVERIKCPAPSKLDMHKKEVLTENDNAVGGKCYYKRPGVSIIYRDISIEIRCRPEDTPNVFYRTIKKEDTFWAKDNNVYCPADMVASSLICQFTDVEVYKFSDDYIIGVGCNEKAAATNAMVRCKYPYCRS